MQAMLQNDGNSLASVPWRQQSEEGILAIQIVMDSTGDSRHRFDPNNAQELANAEQRFYDLTAAGFTAAVRTGPGQLPASISFSTRARDGVLPQADRRLIAGSAMLRFASSRRGERSRRRAVRPSFH